MQEFKPKGVTLTDPEDFTTQRQQIFDSVHKATTESFPRVFGGVRIELNDTAYEGPEDYTSEEQKDAILNDRYLTRKLKGTLNLFDDKTNELLDSRRGTLLNVPWLSHRGTFLHKGNNYTSIRQLRLVPGPYGRVMDNGNMEVHLNVKPGSGSSYRVMMEPSTAQFRLKVGAQAEIHLYSILKDMGVPDDQLKTAWGEGTWQRNASKYNPRAFGQAYAKMVPKREQTPDADMATKVEQMRTAFNRSQILKSVRDQHLPFQTDQVKRAALEREIASTDAEAQDLEATFKPDFTPEELRDVTNAIYGKSGPRMASMQAWPEDWINKDADPLGWLEWYDNYAGGRRSDDDARQIQRWIRFKRRESANFQKNPSAQRAFALRNWAIDAKKLIPQEEHGKLDSAMQTHKDKRWSEHLSKKAALDWGDLQALALHLNQCSQAGIDLTGTTEALEDAIKEFLSRQDGDAFLQAASTLKGAALAHMAIRRPDSFEIEVSAEGLQVKCAGRKITGSETLQAFEEVLACRI